MWRGFGIEVLCPPRLPKGVVPILGEHLRTMGRYRLRKIRIAGKRWRPTRKRESFKVPPAFQMAGLLSAEA